MTSRRSQRVLIVACLLGLIALGLMVWSVVAPAPLSVMVAMTVGQVIGTVSFGLYGWVVLVALRRARILDEREDG